MRSINTVVAAVSGTSWRGDKSGPAGIYRPTRPRPEHIAWEQSSHEGPTNAGLRPALCGDFRRTEVVERGNDPGIDTGKSMPAETNGRTEQGIDYRHVQTLFDRQHFRLCQILQHPANQPDAACVHGVRFVSECVGPQPKSY